MENSLVTMFSAVLSAVVTDCKRAYPKERTLARDLVRLQTLLRSRGVPSMMVDLPNLSTLLIQGLESGRLELSGPLSKRVSKRIKVPRLFSGLWLRIFSKDGVLLQNEDINAIDLLYQITNLFKKQTYPTSEENNFSAIEEYYSIEDEMDSPTLMWADDSLDSLVDPGTVHFCDYLDQPTDRDTYPCSENPSNGIGLKHLNGLQKFCDSVSSSLGLFSPEEFFSSGVLDRKIVAKHGTGAVSDRCKFDDLYRFSSWPRQLDTMFPYDAFAIHSINDIDSYDDVDTSYGHSTLVSVPKTLKKPRLVAKENSALRFCQQITRYWLQDRFKQTWIGSFIDLNDQSKSGRMVKEHSISRQCATVDLSSASDRISCKAIERFLRKNQPLLLALHACRSRYLINETGHGPSVAFLKKFATQGTAVTFPIQSIFFLTIALYSLGCRSIKDTAKWKGTVRVYGDDIILPTHGYDKFKEMLHFLGLKVNVLKTFTLGHFRESCGSDFYKGYDITPVKPVSFTCRGPDSWNSIIDTSNNLFKKGLWNTADTLHKTLPDWILRSLPVVSLESGELGLTSFCGDDISRLKSKYNHDLQRYEVKTFQLLNRSRRAATNSMSAFLQYLVEVPDSSPYQDWSSGSQTKPKVVTDFRWAGVDSFDCIEGRGISL